MCTALAVIFTVARMRLQYLHNRELYINDYLIYLAMIFHLISTIVYEVMSLPMHSLVAAKFGLEQVTALNISRFEYYLRLQFIPRSTNSSHNQRYYGRRNGATFDSLPRIYTLPLQNIVKNRPLQYVNPAAPRR